MPEGDEVAFGECVEGTDYVSAFEFAALCELPAADGDNARGGAALQACEFQERAELGLFERGGVVRQGFDQLLITNVM